ncbi:membrane protein [Streptomyces fumigatiscleroticus]|nr:membrane protein [Streptomyces fumigatiscleroticus]
MSIPPPPGPHQPQEPGGPYPPSPTPYQQGPHQQGPYQPYQPYQQNPYGPPSYPAHGPFSPPAPVNGVAIAALVLGVLCFLPAVGLVLGLVALGQIKKRGERGKGLAVAGSVLSSIGLALWVVSLSTGAAADFWEGFRDAARGEGTAYALTEGDCFDVPGGSLEGFAYDVDEVPCAGEHDGEVFAVFGMAEGSYPGDGEVTETADDKCYTLQDGYAMDTWAVPEDVDVFYLTPTRESWGAGDREITCVFGSADGTSTLTGSLRNDATTLDAHQVAYLKAARVLNTALDSAPEEEYVEDDLPGHKEWAGRVAEALTEQTGMLRGHDWPADAEQPVAGLLEDLDAAQREWSRAAGAGDVDTFYEHYDAGYDLVDPQKSVTARKALGLATTPPSYESYEEGDDGGEGEGGMEV